MDKTTFQRLDFPAVLEQLARLAQSDAAKNEVLHTTPWTDADEIRHHARAVDEILHILDTGDKLSINGFDDCGDVLTRMKTPGLVLEAEEWLRLRAFLATGKALHRQATHAEDGQLPILKQRLAHYEPLPELIAAISRVFDDDGHIRDSASEGLRQARHAIRRLEREINRTFERLVSKLGSSNVLQDSYSTDRNGRRVLPVRAGSRGKVQGIVHGTSNTGETLFIEPLEAIEPTNKLAEARNKERQEIVLILDDLTKEGRESLDILKDDREALLQVDLWHTRAMFAHRHGLHNPNIEPGKPLQLLAAHHPLLYLNDDIDSVPMELYFDAENKVLVVTGPNTGGKTTALKCIGLLQLMAQSAIPIPAGVDSHLPVFKQVLAEVGDEQSVAEGLSTFSAHIRRISWILEHCRGGALVLLDELGKATDPMQAGGLARAILEALIERGALTLVTTHLSTLKDWAHDHPNGRNASYHLDPETHRPLYRLKMDTPGISEAFTIALAEGLPADIVEAAREQIPKEERDLSEMLETLHEQEERLRESLAEARSEKSKAEKLQKRLDMERAAAQKAKVHAEKQLEREYKELLDKARADIEKRIANLPSRRAMSEARDALARDQKSAQKRLDAMEERERKILEKTVPPEEKPEPVEDREPEEGDYVTIKKGNQTGRIESLDKAKGRATVSMGGLTVQTKIKDLTLADAPEKTRVQSSRASRFTAGSGARSVAREINLTGERVEPAIDRLDRYIDSALLANMPSVRVIHGFGTGALRSAVHEFLGRHPQVKRFELAPRDEGGGGATIAYLQ